VSDNCISVSSERILLLNEIEHIQSLFYLKFAEYENAKQEGLECKSLLVECENLAGQSQTLIDQL